MPTFTSDGLTLAYDDNVPPGGGERTIVLVHGFSSNRSEGWKRTGWYTAFDRRRIRCIALDQRGHGESAKPHEADAYTRAKLAGDVIALLDHLGLNRVDLFGYSMGSRTALATALLAQERAFLESLRRTSRYKVEDQQLILESANSSVVLMFTR